MISNLNDDEKNRWDKSMAAYQDRGKRKGLRPIYWLIIGLLLACGLWAIVWDYQLRILPPIDQDEQVRQSMKDTLLFDHSKIPDSL